MSGTEENFTYFISLAIENKLPWESLETILKDWTPTLTKAKRLIEILLTELQMMHSKLQEHQTQYSKPLHDTNKDSEKENNGSEIMEVDQLLTTLKLLIIGESSVGKSSLLLRFTDDAFDPEQAATIGVDFKVKTININGDKVSLL